MFKQSSFCAMICKTKPIVIDKGQYNKCILCRYISGKKIWCCKWGFNVYQDYTDKEKLPDMLAMSKSLGKAVVEQTKSGWKFRSAEEIERIKEICVNCPRHFFENGKLKCKECGCNMEIKISWKSTKCPIGMW